MAELGIGGAFKDSMAQPGSWTIGGTAFGEMLPDHRNMISIDENTRDKWGLPVLKIDCEIGENERMMRKDMTTELAEMFESSGARMSALSTTATHPGRVFTRWGRRAWAATPRPRC